jgi:K+-sensing histidine kinase KdpD
MQSQALIMASSTGEDAAPVWYGPEPDSQSDPLGIWSRRGILSTVAHELRTPIAALTLSSELLSQDLDTLDRERARALVVGIHRRALWIQELVENVLCADTFGSGRFRLSPRPLRLAEIIEDVHRIVEPILSQRGQALRSKVPSSIRCLVADNRRIGQVLVNLLSNASKFGPQGSPIDVVATVRGNRVRLTVADRGTGFPPAQARQLFEPFHRVAPKCGPTPEGIGLGLAIVKTIVELHGGRVGARNRPGGGACFWFDLPIPTLTVLPGRDRSHVDGGVGA